MDSGRAVDIIYIDAAKAFDSVSHTKLIFKLSRCGIEGNLLRWFQSFLKHRTQCVRVGNHLSPFVDVGSGIGQGTILESILFILFINDVRFSIGGENKVKSMLMISKYMDPMKITQVSNLSLII